MLLLFYLEDKIRNLRSFFEYKDYLCEEQPKIKNLFTNNYAQILWLIGKVL